MMIYYYYITDYEKIMKGYQNHSISFNPSDFFPLKFDKPPNNLEQFLLYTEAILYPILLMPLFMVISLVIQVNCTFLMLARMLEGFRYEFMDQSSGIPLIQQSLINHLIGVLSNIDTRNICYRNTNS